MDSIPLGESLSFHITAEHKAVLKKRKFIALKFFAMKFTIFAPVLKQSRNLEFLILNL